MESDFWISQLGRLYKEANSQVDSTGGAAPLAKQFNEALESLQEEFTDNDFVQSTEKISVPRSHDVFEQADVAPEVRTKTGQLADAIGYDLPEEDLRQQDSPMNVIQLDQKQSSQQTVQQTVTVESTMEMINHLPRDEDTTDELRSLVEQFQDELESEGPDESKLRTFIKEAGQKSPEVAANLGMLALQKGMISVLGL